MKEIEEICLSKSISNKNQNSNKYCGICEKKTGYGLDLKAFPVLRNYDKKYEEILKKTINEKGSICAKCYFKVFNIEKLYCTSINFEEEKISLFGDLISALLFLNETEGNELDRHSKFRFYEVDVKDIIFEQLAIPEYLEKEELESFARKRDEFWIIKKENDKKIKYSRSYLIRILEMYTIVEEFYKEKDKNKPKECLEDFKYVRSGDYFLKNIVYYDKIKEKKYE